LPYGYQVDVPGFTTLPCGGGQGDLADSIVSRSSETYLKTRSSRQPFVLVSSLMQPHDICYWAIQDKELVPPGLPFERLADNLPPLPPNHTARPKAPEYLDNIKYTRYSEEQWRYYLYIYYRQVEMLDADVGRILDGLEDAGLEEDTVVCFTSDHGDGRGRHMHVQKWYPYEESVKVPFIMSCPERMESGVRDETSLLSGIDILPTFCDFAGLDAPEGTTGASVRPLCEGRPNAPWRDYVVADTHVIGRMVRTDRWKFVTYEDDPVEQLFDMDNDPWETQNLAGEDQYASIIEDHRQMLTEWESRLDKVDPTSRPNR
jgi:arylsulfatase A-like enzyme